MPKFSVIMPSYLGEYNYAAKNREEKLVRAVESVLVQEDFELIIISDGCEQTISIIKDNFKVPEIKLFYLPKRKIKGKRNAGAAGIPRNGGLQQAVGEYVIYLDTDDKYREGYLKDLSAEMTDCDWYWFDDLSFNKNTGIFDRHVCNINVQGQCGTSNVCHKLSMNAFWSEKVTYLHDWFFVNTLKQISNNYKRLNLAGYQICHVPTLLDV